jgi:hypothetical protein
MATKTSGYAVATKDRDALCEALVTVLKSYPFKEREAALAKLCEDERVEKVLTDFFKSRGVTVERKFSPLAKGIENYSSMIVGGGASAGSGVTNGNALRKRMNRLAAGGES